MPVLKCNLCGLAKPVNLERAGEPVDRQSMLANAIRRDDSKEAKELIDAGAIVDGSMLINAITFHNSHILKFLLTHVHLGHDVVNFEDLSGYTPLMWNMVAVFSKLRHRGDVTREDVTDMLISKNADLNVRDRYGMTALMHAAKHEHVICVHILVDARADVDLRNYNKDTALMLTQNLKIQEILRNASEVRRQRELYWKRHRGRQIK